jgi:hypothetical protein
MHSTHWAAGALAAVLFAGCGGDKPTVFVDEPKTRGGSSSAGGKGGNSSDGGEDSAGGMGAESGDPLAPQLVITSPQGTQDPNGARVLIGDEVTVTCRAVRSRVDGAGEVNASSVKLALLDAAGKVVEEKVGTVAKAEDEYQGEFSLVTLASGPIRFRCSAEDAAKRAASTQLDTLLDRGPSIELIQPVSMAAHALSQPLDVEFKVTPALLTEEDEQAGVRAVSLDVAGVDIDLAGAEEEPGHYRLQIDLSDPKFTPAPNGPVPLTVKATNERAPEAVTTTLAEQAIIDGAGPTIAIVGPLDKATVGGNVQLRFTVKDAVSGVDSNSVEVALNDVKHPYDPDSDQWSLVDDAYTFEFDSRLVKNSKVQITVNVGARDKVGNAAAAVSELLYLDNFPPDVDLDPLNIRTKSLAGGRCSVSFDPVGVDAENDLGVANVASIFRAVVWDKTNSDPSIPIAHFSKTDPSSVRLYLEAGPIKPLLIDKDKDGICDEVAEVDSTNSIVLNTVEKVQTPWYSSEGAEVAPAAAALRCKEETALGTQPKKLCTSEKSDMWHVIDDNYNQTPVIYGASVTSGAECTGVAWEFTSKVDTDGWVCFAARAADNVGNVGVSRPLRVCVDDPSIPGTPPCANSSTTPPPSCTDGCTPPARWGNVAVETP